MFCELCKNCGVIKHEKTCRSCGYREIKTYISLADYFRCYINNINDPRRGRDFRELPEYAREITPEVEKEAEAFLFKVNSLLTQLEELGCEFEVKLSSGFRPKSYAHELKMNPGSPHCKAIAVDIKDKGNKIYDAIYALALANSPEDLLTKLGLFMEDKAFTKTWVHLDAHPRRDRKIRVFKP